MTVVSHRPPRPMALAAFTLFVLLSAVGRATGTGTFCASCADVGFCFEPRLCPHFWGGRWQPPYAACNAAVQSSEKAACSSCFPAWNCSGPPKDPMAPAHTPSPSFEAPQPPAPSASVPSPTPPPFPSPSGQEPPKDPKEDVPGMTAASCPPRCLGAADRCFGELACVHFLDGAWHGPHTHCNAFLGCSSCYPETSCTAPIRRDRPIFSLEDRDQGALEVLAAAGMIAAAHCSSPEVTCSAGVPLRVRSLNVRSTSGTAGQLSWLEPLTALEWLAVPPSFSGSLASLQGLQRLTTLRLWGPGIHGALDALGGCGRLRHLSLANMRLQGSLYDLMPLRALEVVTLHNVSVAGSLAALRGLAGITTVSLANTGLAGSLAHLRGLANLTTLALVDSPVGGSLAEIRALRWR